MNIEEKRILIEKLANLVTPQRFARMQAVLNNRTRYVTAILEDVYRSPNSNAAIRSLECFGLQDVHLAEGRYKAKLNDAIAKGATQWMTIKRYESDAQNLQDGIVKCFKALKEQGYMLIATTPHPQGYSLNELPIDKKIALIFGNEEAGVSAYAQEHADAYMTIPMYGFTESFNIAASVAITTYDLITRIKKSSIDWSLSEEEKLDVLSDWLQAAGR